MIQTPGKHVPSIKNRSSKQYYNLTRRGIQAMNKWHRSLGIPAYTPPRVAKPKTKPAPKAN